MKRNNNKLGHQAPKGLRINRFNAIHLDGDHAYCTSHNFVYSPDVEELKLHRGLPCYHTDSRYHDGQNYFKSAYIRGTRSSEISLKTAIRTINKVRNIKKGTIVSFIKSWYLTAHSHVDLSYRFKVKKENTFDPEYQVNDPAFTRNFVHDKKSAELINKLRELGFLVRVTPNESFLLSMVNTGASIPGETAIAFGLGLKIGISSFDNDLFGYSNARSAILWDEYDEFDKWSRCNEISKDQSVDDIIKEIQQIHQYQNHTKTVK